MLADAPTNKALSQLNTAQLQTLGAHVDYLIDEKVKPRFGGVEADFNKNLYELYRKRKRKNSVWGMFY